MKRTVLVAASLLVVLACAPAQRARAVDLVLTSRNVPLTGKLTLASADKVVDKLIELDSISDRPIFLKINAQGEALEAAFAVADTIRAIRSPVYAVVQSRAYDAVAVLAVLCEKTWAYPNAVFMFAPVEKVSGEVKPPKEPSKEFLEQFRNEVYAAIAKAIGAKPADFAENVKDGWWLTAAEAEKAGVVDGLVESIAYKELLIEKTEVKTTVQTVEETQLSPVRDEDADE